ncbi:TPA: DUF551 domain-containing protein [Klebsiella pneumoniae]
MGHELLVAMDSSESVELPLDYLQGHKDGLELAAQLAESNHPETGDWLYDDPIELAKAIRKGPDMPPVQPVPEYPETLPCPVLLEPGLRFGKGIKTSTMLAALARRAVHESDMAALSPEERVEFQARIEDFKALIAQPAPVVPDDVLDALQKVARIRLDMNDFDGDRRGIADCLGDAEEALIEVVNRRAAMLATAPQSPGSEPATVPGKWIPVSERMPIEFEAVIAFDGDQVYGEAMYSSDDGFTIDGYEPCDRLNLQNVTHWMPLPAAPQEVKGD